MLKRYLVSVILARREEEIMPKKKYLDTGAAVKPETSMLTQMVVRAREQTSRLFNSRCKWFKLFMMEVIL